MTTGDMDRPSEGERPGAVDDAVWTELVAAFHASTADQAGLWPDAENLPDGGTQPLPGDIAPATPSRVVRPASQPGQQPPPPQTPPAVTWTAPGPRDWDRAPEPEEGYTPPPPPPLPELGMATKTAWIAGLGGPAYLALATLLHWQTPQWAALLCVLSGVVGFAYLVSRLKDRPGDGDDDPDDPTYGAVL